MSNVVALPLRQRAELMTLDEVIATLEPLDCPHRFADQTLELDGERTILVCLACFECRPLPPRCPCGGMIERKHCGAGMRLAWCRDCEKLVLECRT